MRSAVVSLLTDAGLLAAEVDEPVRVFGGNARRAWSCTATWDGQAHELILLVRLPGSQVQTDPALEDTVLGALSDKGVRAPRLWASGDVDGSPAVLLERLSGSADAVAFLNAPVEVGRARTLDLARAAAELHAVPAADVPLEPVDVVGHWRRQFLDCRLEPHPTLSWLFDWLSSTRVEPARLSVVHGDFRPGNVLYDEKGIVGLLDWEMAHVGDPVEDLAWAYRTLWSPSRFVPLDEFTKAYEAAGGRTITPETLTWHRVLAEVKFATISLLAARAVVDGTSHNLRLIDRASTVLPATSLALDLVRAC